MEFRVQGLGFRVQGFRVLAGVRVWGLGFCFGFGVQVFVLGWGSGFRARLKQILESCSFSPDIYIYIYILIIYIYIYYT